MIEIDTLSDGSAYDYTQTTQLDGVSYRLRMLYNDRRGVWTLSMYLEDGTPLIEGQSCVMFVDLLRRCIVQGRPSGALIVSTFTANNETPELLDIGQNARCRLFYLDADEVDEWQS